MTLQKYKKYLYFQQIFAEKFWKYKKKYYLCTRKTQDGGVAQLVRASDS